MSRAPYARSFRTAGWETGAPVGKRAHKTPQFRPENAIICFIANCKPPYNLIV